MGARAQHAWLRPWQPFWCGVEGHVAVSWQAGPSLICPLCQCDPAAKWGGLRWGEEKRSYWWLGALVFLIIVTVCCQDRSYLSYRYPNTEIRTSYMLLAAKTAAVISLKAFSFPEPSLTPSSLPSNKFFLKSVWREREEGWRGGEGTPPFCHNASSCELKRGWTCLLWDSPADTGALTRTGLRGIAQHGQSRVATTADLSL